MVGAEEVKPRDLLLVRLDEELPEARVLSFLHALRIIVAAGVSGEDRCTFCGLVDSAPEFTPRLVASPKFQGPPKKVEMSSML